MRYRAEMRTAILLAALAIMGLPAKSDGPSKDSKTFPSLAHVVPALATAKGIVIGVEYELGFVNHGEGSVPITLDLSEQHTGRLFQEIVRQLPNYQYSFSNGVHNLWPRKSADPLASVPIRTFSLTKADLDEASGALSDIPEFKKWMAERNLSRGEFWNGSLRTKERLSLTLNYTSFQAILNELTKRFGRSYWSVVRYSTVFEGKKLNFIAIYFNR